MFQIVLTVICAVFVIGYIFFAAAGEHDSAPEKAAPRVYTNDDQSAA